MTPEVLQVSKPPRDSEQPPLLFKPRGKHSLWGEPTFHWAPGGRVPSGAPVPLRPPAVRPALCRGAFLSPQPRREQMHPCHQKDVYAKDLATNSKTLKSSPQGLS